MSDGPDLSIFPWAVYMENFSCFLNEIEAKNELLHPDEYRTNARLARERHGLKNLSPRRDGEVRAHREKF